MTADCPLCGRCDVAVAILDERPTLTQHVIPVAVVVDQAKPSLRAYCPLSGARLIEQ